VPGFLHYSVFHQRAACYRSSMPELEAASDIVNNEQRERPATNRPALGSCAGARYGNQPVEPSLCGGAADMPGHLGRTTSRNLLDGQARPLRYPAEAMSYQGYRAS
jgi:hypothetical protein